jgi:hypothetical protein
MNNAKHDFPLILTNFVGSGDPDGCMQLCPRRWAPVAPRRARACLPLQNMVHICSSSTHPPAEAAALTASLLSIRVLLALQQTSTMRAPVCGTKLTEQRVHGDQQAPRPAWDSRQRDAVVAVAKEHVDEALPGHSQAGAWRTTP